MEAKTAAISFVGGLVMTLVLVVLVPVFIDTYASKWISDVVGDNQFLFLSSDIIITLLVWLVIIAFMVVLGAGGILKKFGIFGIVGLIVAYWLLGDVTDAIVPLVTLAIILVILKTIQIKKSKKNTEK